MTDGEAAFRSLAQPAQPCDRSPIGLDGRATSRLPMVAALFVQRGGAYYGIPDVDPWDEARDARLYAGPWPVVAHPPCARWGRLAESAFGRRFNLKRGDDGGCFAAAIASVRRWGGVLEHPEASSAWSAFGLIEPERGVGWVGAGDWLGWSCSVEQGHFGHRTRKASWLYAVGPGALPSLPWGASSPEGFVSCRHKGEAFTRLSRHQRAATPPAFRDLLLSIARTSSAQPEATPLAATGTPERGFCASEEVNASPATGPKEGAK
jgi:hypothetical protein